MQDQSETPLVDPMGECTNPLINLILVGRATPYLHNGSMMIEDDNGVVSIGIRIRISISRCICIRKGRSYSMK